MSCIKIRWCISSEGTFLGGPKKHFICPHPSAPIVAKHLREEIQNKEPREHYTSFPNTSTLPKNHGSNQETPQTLPACTTTSNVQPKSNILDASSSRGPIDFRNVSTHQASLQESLTMDILMIHNWLLLEQFTF